MLSIASYSKWGRTSRHHLWTGQKRSLRTTFEQGPGDLHPTRPEEICCTGQWAPSQLPLSTICKLQGKKQRMDPYSSSSDSARTFLHVEPFAASEGKFDELLGRESLLQDKVKI